MGTVPTGTGQLRRIHSRVWWILRPVERSISVSPPHLTDQRIFSTSSSIEEATAELPMFVLILMRKLRPITIGSSSGWLMLAGMIARPRATSSRTNSRVISKGIEAPRPWPGCWRHGVPAPLIYTVENQLSAVVPYAVAGKSSTQVQVEYRGTRSAPVTLQLAPVSPAIFTLDSSGRGAGAILNQDSSVNSPANPARIGFVVSIFATGEGQTSPGGVDGKPGSDPVPHPIFPVSVTIGGQIVTPTYAGGAPGNVAGLMQVNVQVPIGIQTGSAVPVLLKGGNESSQAGVTIAVRSSFSKGREHEDQRCFSITCISSRSDSEGGSTIARHIHGDLQHDHGPLFSHGHPAHRRQSLDRRRKQYRHENGCLQGRVQRRVVRSSHWRV